MPVFDTPLTTNDQSLDRVLTAGLPVLLVLWKEQPLPQAVEDALHAVAKAEAGKLLVVRLDLLDNPDSAVRWSGLQFPALVLVRDGVPDGDPARLTSPDLVGDFAAYLLGRGERPAVAAPRAATGTAGSGADLAWPVDVSDATFQREVLDSRVPVVVDFWAPWCGPCRAVAPALEKLAAEFGGQVKIAKVNVDHNPQWAGHYGVQGIPTMLLVKQGQIVERVVGARPEHDLRRMISGLL